MALGRLLSLPVMLSTMTLFASGGNASGVGNASFDAKFINCAGQPWATVLVIRDLKNGAIVLKTRVTNHDSTASDFHGLLPEGLYGFRVSTGRCYGGGSAGLLAGRTRTLAIGGALETPEPLPSGLAVVGHDELKSNGTYALAGRLPLDGLAVRILDGCGTSFPVFIDNGAYYADSLPAGHYFIDVRGTGGGTIVKVSLMQRNSLTVRDFSFKEIESGRWVDVECARSQSSFPARPPLRVTRLAAKQTAYRSGLR